MTSGQSRSGAVDAHVGRRIRLQRISIGLTQQDLATKIGVTYQQQHKYERGINRVTAGRLFEIGEALGVEIGHFYEGLSSESDASPAIRGRERLQLELARNFSEIAEPAQQKAVSDLARALAADPAKSD
jgi:transcriptional regulator with XRE-family HTH domain